MTGFLKFMNIFAREGNFLEIKEFCIITAELSEKLRSINTMTLE